jgi:hypothetical protein
VQKDQVFVANGDCPFVNRAAVKILEFDLMLLSGGAGKAKRFK